MSARRGETGDDPHARFGEWLTDGAQDDLPRDLAVHAAVCPDCRLQIAADDLLTGVDPSRAGPPPRRAAVLRTRRSVATRAGLAAAGLALLGVTVAVGVGSLRLALVGGDPAASATETLAQAVLGNTGRPATSSEVEATATATATATARPRPTRAERTVSPDPVSIPSVPPDPIATSVPTAEPTRRASATPRPTVAPTATPAPTAPPTPIPVPDDCADGIDNDGDLLIDLADPGCVLDGNEPSA